MASTKQDTEVTQMFRINTHIFYIRNLNFANWISSCYVGEFCFSHKAIVDI